MTTSTADDEVSFRLTKQNIGFKYFLCSQIIKGFMQRKIKLRIRICRFCNFLLKSSKVSHVLG